MAEQRPTNEDLHDAVTDRLLAEAVGGETPPDLRDKIIKRAAASPGAQRSIAWRRLAAFAVAACLTVVVSSALLLPNDANQGREVGKRLGDQTLIEATPEQLVQLEAGQPVVVDRDAGVRVDKSTPPPEALATKAEARSESAVQRSLAPEAVAGAPFSSNSAPVNDGRLPQEESFALDSVVATEGVEASPSSTPVPASAAEGLAAGGRLARGAPVLGQPLAPAAAAPTRSPPSERFYGYSETRRSKLGVADGEAVGDGVRSWGERYQPEFSPQERWRGRGRFAVPDGDRYEPIVENSFTIPRGEEALSTFSIDVDTASYANVRQFLQQMRRLPPPNAVRIEELVNYFEYDYAPPSESDEAPFASSIEVANCPWAPKHRLVRIGVKGREVETEKRPLSNLVFLVDVSGSMQDANKLPLLVSGLKRLTRRLGENDRVAIVVYASSEGVALPSTSGAERGTILAALDNLRAGGSTAGGAGIQLAYELAEQNFIEGGVNRVLLCTDGDFNVGVTNTDALADLVEMKAKETGVFLSVLGFGRGNLNDAMMETVSGRGNGVYAYIDSDREAHRVLVRQMSGTLVTIAKDVKLQVEFNPQHVARYRLIGYENRMLAAQDFNDDTKDAGEIGAGHTVTALYEIVPTGVAADGDVDELKYQASEQPTADAEPPADPSPEMLTLKIRYKQPDGDVSTKLEFPLVDNGSGLEEASDDFRFASAVAEFGLLLRNSQHKGSASYENLIERAEANVGQDAHGDRAEFVGLARQAAVLQSRGR